ncbi:hypothetical protein WA026_017622 [Henosepilachna vigintioctopunctata]|uniref:Uncharacterized protein n=1 Tax=Henosepilachna vigintioctopunctata TaxID=420089 RepID=A0AAW1UV33_9CUCU
MKMINIIKRSLYMYKCLCCDYNKTSGQLDRRRKALEEEYFHKLNRNLLRKLRQIKHERVEKVVEREIKKKNKNKDRILKPDKSPKN